MRKKKEFDSENPFAGAFNESNLEVESKLSGSEKGIDHMSRSMRSPFQNSKVNFFAQALIGDKKILKRQASNHGGLF